MTYNGATATVSALSANTATVTCTVDQIPTYGSLSLTKVFTVVKQLQGKSIEGVIEYYLATDLEEGVTTDTVGWVNMSTSGATMPQIGPNARYLWNYEQIAKSDGTIDETAPALIGRYSTDGSDGTAGRGIVSIVDYYKVNNTTTALAVSDRYIATGDHNGWSTTPSDVSANNRYLWNYEVITYDKDSSAGANDAVQTSTPSIIGAFGEKGEDGQDGQDGKDGYTPQKGVDYFDGADGKDGKDGKDGENGSSITMKANESACTTIGDAYIDSNGHLKVLNATSPSKTYTDGGKIVGEDGQDATQYYIHYVYCDNTSTGENYHTTQTRKYVGIYTDTTEADASTFATANAKSGIVWSQITGDKGETGTTLVSDTIYYAGTTNTAQPSSGWTTAMVYLSDSTAAPVYYVWQKEEIVYSDASLNKSIAPHIISARGKDGQPGSNADVTFANVCSALGISDVTTVGMYKASNPDRLVINADAIMADYLTAHKITADDIDATNLQVNAANITGTLTIGAANLDSTVTPAAIGAATSTDISSAIGNITPSSIGAATSSDISTAINNLDIPTDISDLTGTSNLATTSDISTAINNLDIPTDISDLNDDIGVATQDDISDFTTESDIATALSTTTSAIYTNATTLTENTISTTNVVAQNLKVNAANITGTLTVSNTTGTIFSADTSTKQVTIGGFIVDDHSIKSHANLTDIGFTGNTKGVYVGKDGIFVKNAYSKTSSSGKYVYLNASDGKIESNNADIKGKITATEGKIGNWTIKSSALYNVSNTTITAPGGASGGIWLSTGITGASGVQIGDMTASSKSWFLAANDKFGVTTSGDVYTKDATIRAKEFKIQTDEDFQNRVNSQLGNTDYANLFNLTDNVTLRNGGRISATTSKEVICEVSKFYGINTGSYSTTDPSYLGRIDGTYTEYPYILAGLQSVDTNYYLAFSVNSTFDHDATIDYVITLPYNNSYSGSVNSNGFSGSADLGLMKAGSIVLPAGYAEVTVDLGHLDQEILSFQNAVDPHYISTLQNGSVLGQVCLGVLITDVHVANET